MGDTSLILFIISALLVISILVYLLKLIRMVSMRRKCGKILLRMEYSLANKIGCVISLGISLIMLSRIIMRLVQMRSGVQQDMSFYMDHLVRGSVLFFAFLFLFLYLLIRTTISENGICQGSRWIGWSNVKQVCRGKDGSIELDLKDYGQSEAPKIFLRCSDTQKNDIEKILHNKGFRF